MHSDKGRLPTLSPAPLDFLDWSWALFRLSRAEDLETIRETLAKFLQFFEDDSDECDREIRSLFRHARDPGTELHMRAVPVGEQRMCTEGMVAFLLFDHLVSTSGADLRTAPEPE